MPERSFLQVCKGMEKWLLACDRSVHVLFSVQDLTFDLKNEKEWESLREAYKKILEYRLLLRPYLIEFSNFPYKADWTSRNLSPRLNSLEGLISLGGDEKGTLLKIFNETLSEIKSRLDDIQMLKEVAVLRHIKELSGTSETGKDGWESAKQLADDNQLTYQYGALRMRLKKERDHHIEGQGWKRVRRKKGQHGPSIYYDQDKPWVNEIVLKVKKKRESEGR